MDGARIWRQVGSKRSPASIRDVSHDPWVFLVAVSVVIMAVASLAVGLVTPPRSGPNCRTGCIDYPYTDAARYVPRDFWWQYPAALLALLSVVLVTSLARRRSAGVQLAGRVASVLASIAAGILVTDYAIQLMVVQPSLLKGQTEGLALWSQYNPHGVFIALENVGYLLMALSFVALGATVDRTASRPERTARIVFTTGGTLTVLAFVASTVGYRANLDDHFEVMGITGDWLVLIVAGTLIAIATGRHGPLQRPPGAADTT